MAETATKPTLLDELRERKTSIGDELDALIDEREGQRTEFEARRADEDKEKHPSDSEIDAYNAAERAFADRVKEFTEDLEALNERIRLQEDKAERRQAAAKASEGSIEVTSEPAVYRRENAHEVSYMKDLILTEPSWKGRINRDWGKAEERLKTHGREVEDKLPKRQLEKQRRMEAEIESADRGFRKEMIAGMRAAGYDGELIRAVGLYRELDNPFERPHHTASEERADPSRQPGAGGEFVPPDWMIADYIRWLRAARTISPLCRNIPMPAGTNHVLVPKIKVPTEVAPQLLDNSGVASRDIQTEYVEAAFKTLAGQEDVAIQLIEQSPGQIFDQVVMEDLVADYGLKVDQNVSYAAGLEASNLGGGTIKGLYPYGNWGGTLNESKITAEQGAHSGAAYLAALAANWSQIAKQRYSTENVHHVLNPRRVGYLASLLDGPEGKSGRPLINAQDFPNFNTGALLGDDTPAEGLMFRTPLGPNVYATNNLHTHDNGKGAYTENGKNDYLLSAKFDDVWFFESDLRTRVLPEVASGTLEVRYQAFAYVGLLVRYGQSIAIAVGSPFEEPEAFGFKF